MGDPGRLFVERGWRIVSVDMDEGAAIRQERIWRLFGTSA